MKNKTKEPILTIMVRKIKDGTRLAVGKSLPLETNCGNTTTRISETIKRNTRLKISAINN